MKIELSELANVKGIGKKTLNRVREYKLSNKGYISKYDEDLHLDINSINKGDCLKLMNGIPDNSIDMILSDLPYGTTNCSWDNIIDLDKLWLQYSRIIKDSGAIVLTASQPFTSKLINSNISWYRYNWVWEKQKASNFFAVKNQPLKYHEDIIVFSKNTHNYNPQKYKVLELEDIKQNIKEKGYNYLEKIINNNQINNFGVIDRRKTINDPKTNKKHIGNEIKRTRSKDDGTRYPKSVLKINKNINDNVHPTQKPVSLFEYLIKTYTDEQDVILDNTAGSGTTAIAAKNTNRNYILIEKEKEYINIIKERLNSNEV